VTGFDLFQYILIIILWLKLNSAVDIWVAGLARFAGLLADPKDSETIPSPICSFTFENTKNQKQESD
jgi:hypothetical protein